jgi:hypothetical protein
MSGPYDGQSTITASIPGLTGGNTLGGYGVEADSPLGIGLHATGKTEAALFDGSVTINGAGATNVDLSVTGRIASGDANNAGGLWVNSAKWMFVGADGVGNIGLFNFTWGLTLDEGGLVSIGTPTQDGRLTVNGGPVTVNGEGGEIVDLSVTGRIASGDANNAGGLWVNSAKSMFVGADGVGNIGLYNGGWGLIMTSTGFVGIGSIAPELALEVDGATGYPATSGTSQTGIARFTASNNNVLDIGQGSSSPYGMWLQAADKTGLNQNYPILLNPNGGSVGIGTMTPNVRLAVDGQGGENVDLSVTGRIVSGDSNNLGGLWVNSSQTMFVGADGANNIGLYNGGWGLTMDSNGTVSVTGDVQITGSDCAENFDIAACAEFEAGTVMVLDDRGLLHESRYAYDKKVAGVISGAGKFKPGLILGHDKQNGIDGHRAPVALVGKVYCKVDGQNTSIEVGDMLTTSATKGHAMKAEDPMKAFGAVIGKALQSLPAGQRGLIPILVALQ